MQSPRYLPSLRAVSRLGKVSRRCFHCSAKVSYLKDQGEDQGQGQGTIDLESALNAWKSEQPPTGNSNDKSDGVSSSAPPESQPRQSFSKASEFESLSSLIKSASSARQTKRPTARKSGEYGFDLESLLSTRNWNWRRKSAKPASPSFRSRVTIQSIDSELRDQLNSKCHDALRPTLDIFSSMPTAVEVYQFYMELVGGLHDQLNSKSSKLVKNDIYLKDTLDEVSRSEWTSKYTELIDAISSKSNQNARSPLMNLLSFPIITNHVLKILGSRFFQAELAMTIFNLLKSDLHLHTISCNQSTYNQILTILWIYYGNVDLMEFEKTYQEMKLLGFRGDFATYNILRVAIDEYGGLRWGISKFNDSGSRVMTREDNARVAYLKNEVEALKSELKNSPLYEPTPDELSKQFRNSWRTF
ncbi:uncharacterized protein LODBEIA_P06280 [Lodderomyces beijingensis]|uniref:Mtf2-like C-terminal domain-containing protein n=1 Tax=Lodderomyces beijingensis TaxID=1775926 RepID=A0ABP0ZDZ6_9ASCO